MKKKIYNYNIIASESYGGIVIDVMLLHCSNAYCAILLTELPIIKLLSAELSIITKKVHY